MQGGIRQKPRGLRLSHRSAHTRLAGDLEPVGGRKPLLDSSISTYSSSSQSLSDVESNTESNDSSLQLPVWMADEITVATIFKSPILGVKESVQYIITETLLLLDYDGDDPFHSLFEDVRTKGPVAFVRGLPDALPAIKALEVLRLVIVIIELPLHLVRRKKVGVKVDVEKQKSAGTMQQSKIGAYSNFAFGLSRGSADVNEPDDAGRLSQEENVPGELVSSSLGTLNDDDQSDNEAPIVFSDDWAQGGQSRAPWSQQFDSAEDEDDDEEEYEWLQGDSEEGTGSALHHLGKCRPCHFHLNVRVGCRNGNTCNFCHLHGKRPSKTKRDREKRRLQREEGSELIDGTRPGSAQSLAEPRPPPKMNLSL